MTFLTGSLHLLTLFDVLKEPCLRSWQAWDQLSGVFLTDCCDDAWMIRFYDVFSGCLEFHLSKDYAAAVVVVFAATIVCLDRLLYFDAMKTLI